MPPLLPKAELQSILRRAGFDGETIEQALSGLPDPVELDDARPQLGRYGITLTEVESRLGGSP